MTLRQRQACVLLRFPKGPLALKVCTALRWIESEDVTWGNVMRDVAAFTPGKKRFSKSLHSPKVWPLWGCDGVFYKALVLNLWAQFKCITPPERPFYVVSQGQMMGIGLIMALKNHKHFYCTLTFKYYMVVCSIFYKDIRHSFVLYHTWFVDLSALL